MHIDRHALQPTRFPFIPRVIVVLINRDINTGYSGKTVSSRRVVRRRHGLRYRSQIKNVLHTNASFLPQFYTNNKKDTLIKNKTDSTNLSTASKKPAIQLVLVNSVVK